MQPSGEAAQQPGLFTEFVSENSECYGVPDIISRINAALVLPPEDVPRQRTDWLRGVVDCLEDIDAGQGLAMVDGLVALAHLMPLKTHLSERYGIFLAAEHTYQRLERLRLQGNVRDISDQAVGVASIFGMRRGYEEVVERAKKEVRFSLDQSPNQSFVDTHHQTRKLSRLCAITRDPSDVSLLCQMFYTDCLCAAERTGQTLDVLGVVEDLCMEAMILYGAGDIVPDILDWFFSPTSPLKDSRRTKEQIMLGLEVCRRKKTAAKADYLEAVWATEQPGTLFD